MRSYWSRTHVLIRKGRFVDKGETHKEGHLMMETETAVMKLEGKECQGCQQIPKREVWNRFSLKTFKRNQPY